MKQSTKLLSLVLAIVMAFSCMSVIGSAADSISSHEAVTYDSIDDALLTRLLLLNFIMIISLILSVNAPHLRIIKFFHAYFMKQSTKLLSLVLAIVMAFSCMSVIGSAADSISSHEAVTYDSIDDALLTSFYC